jgi:HEPN domain-containing protein
LTHMVAFHSQQCIEKSLKAVMEEYGIELVNKQQEKIRVIREIRAKKIRKA